MKKILMIFILVLCPATMLFISAKPNENWNLEIDLAPKVKYTTTEFTSSRKSEVSEGLDFFNDSIGPQCRYLVDLFDEEAYENEYLPTDSFTGEIK
jgi:hypothetical protein